MKSENDKNTASIIPIIINIVDDNVKKSGNIQTTESAAKNALYGRSASASKKPFLISPVTLTLYVTPSVSIYRYTNVK